MRGFTLTLVFISIIGHDYLPIQRTNMQANKQTGDTHRNRLENGIATGARRLNGIAHADAVREVLDLDGIPVGRQAL